MLYLDLATAQAMLAAAFRFARERNLKPLAVAVLDARGTLKVFAAEDNTSLRRAEIAQGKANAALAMGLGGTELEERALKRPHFISAVGQATGAAFVPGRGGVLVKNSTGTVLGSVGISGDLSENDELAALTAISAVGLLAEA